MPRDQVRAGGSLTRTRGRQYSNIDPSRPETGNGEPDGETISTETGEGGVGVGYKGNAPQEIPPYEVEFSARPAMGKATVAAWKRAREESKNESCMARTRVRVVGGRWEATRETALLLPVERGSGWSASFEVTKESVHPRKGASGLDGASRKRRGARCQGKEKGDERRPTRPKNRG